MSKSVIAFLLATNLATGAGLLYYHGEPSNYQQSSQRESPTKTTDDERAIVGAACVDWLNKVMADEGAVGNTVVLGRSWRKFDHLIFEILPGPDFDHTKMYSPIRPYVWPGVLCAYDPQSDTFHQIGRKERERWMFY